MTIDVMKESCRSSKRPLCSAQFAQFRNGQKPKKTRHPLAKPGFLLVGRRLDALELQPGHGALGHGGPLLEVLKDQLPARGPHDLAPVGPGVVGQAPPVRDTLHHLAAAGILLSETSCKTFETSRQAIF